MAMYRIYDEPIYSYYRDIIDFYIQSRESITCRKLNAAINPYIVARGILFCECAELKSAHSLFCLEQFLIK